MLTEEQITRLADRFTCREKDAFDSLREWESDPGESEEAAQYAMERAYAILEEDEGGDYSRVEEAARELITKAGLPPEGEAVRRLHGELMRRCILLACYESEKYQGEFSGIYHRSMEEIAQRNSSCPKD